MSEIDFVRNVTLLPPQLRSSYNHTLLNDVPIHWSRFEIAKNYPPTRSRHIKKLWLADGDSSDIGAVSCWCLSLCAWMGKYGNIVWSVCSGGRLRWSSSRFKIQRSEVWSCVVFVTCSLIYEVALRALIQFVCFTRLPLFQLRVGVSWQNKIKSAILLDLCVSSLRRGHANLLCIVPIFTDDHRSGSYLITAPRA